jgi:hypothetical protein
MSIIRKTQTGYEFQEGERIVKNLKVVFDARKGCGDIKLPENAYGKKWLSESRFTEGITEIDLGNMPSRNQGGSIQPTTPKLKWEDFVTEEDQKILAEIKTRAEKRMAKADLEAKVKKYQEENAKMMALLEAEG